MGKDIRRMMKEPRVRYIFIGTIVALVLVSLAGGWLYDKALADIPMIAPKEYLVAIPVFIVGASGIYLFVQAAKESDYQQKTRREYRRDSKRYSALSRSELEEHFANADPYQMDVSELPVQDWHDAKGVILGKVGNRLIRRGSAEAGNLAVFGLPGTGKTLAQLVPTALRFGGSTVVIDIKGDILEYTKDERNIKVFSPEDPGTSCHFNPLGGVQNMDTAELRVFLESLALAILPDPKEKEHYFTEGGRDFFCGVALYLLTQDINTPFRDIVSAILRGNAFQWAHEISESDCMDARDYTDSYIGSNERNVAGCYNCICRALRPFSNGKIAQLLDGEGDSLSIDMLDRGYDIYLEIPQDKIKVYAPIMTIIIDSLMSSFMRRPDVVKDKNVRPVLFILDEFPQLNFDFDTLSIALSTLRSKKVSVFLAQQSAAQIEYRYGEAGFREIIDTCSYISVMSAQDPKSREFFQKLFGMHKTFKTSRSAKAPRLLSWLDAESPTVSIHEEREYIFQAEDFSNLGGKVAIYANGRHYVADKTFAFE